MQLKSEKQGKRKKKIHEKELIQNTRSAFCFLAQILGEYFTKFSMHVIMNSEALHTDLGYVLAKLNPHALLNKKSIESSFEEAKH